MKDIGVALRTLLDTAILLHAQCCQETLAVWMQEQSSSLIVYLSRRYVQQIHLDKKDTSVSSTSTDWAKRIDQALAVDQVDLEHVERLVAQFRLARDQEVVQETVRSELIAVKRQLDAFRALLLDCSTTLSRGEGIASSGGSSQSPRLTSTALKATIKDVDDELLHADSDCGVVDVAIVGAGLAGLCAGAILNTLYGKTVAIYESHYLPGGCAHAFERVASNGQTFTFDSGPTILLGCSSPPFNALRQVLDAVGQSVDWIPYNGWGMIENPGKPNELRWRVELGPDRFESGPLKNFGGEEALQEFNELQKRTRGLLAGASIPALAMRSGSQALFPLLRYLPTLVKLISQGETTTGTFAPFMDGPIFTVNNPWLRNWLDALAFSLSGLPASRTAAAAMAFVINDMHRPGASLDYPAGGMGAIVDALVRGVEQGSNRSKLVLRSHVESIDSSVDASRIVGITLTSGKKVLVRDGVICNAPVWSLKDLIKDRRVLERLNSGFPVTEVQSRASWIVSKQGFNIRIKVDTNQNDLGLLTRCDSAEQTGSFLHLHIALNATGLNLDSLEAHYTVMDRGLNGDGTLVNGVEDGPCGELNMIAVSNPCVLDRTLAPEGYIVLHAYGAGNEPYERWDGMDRGTTEYRELKEQRADVLWRAVESIIPDVRERAVLYLIGSPLTHERFLRRPNGTYGSATEDYLKDGSTPFDTLVLANDGVFPGIGVPSVCIAGASAANAFVSVLRQWRCLDELQQNGRIT